MLDAHRASHLSPPKTTSSRIPDSNMPVKIVAMSNDRQSASCSTDHSFPSSSTSNATKEDYSLSIVYGNEAQYVGDAHHHLELPQGHTHRWTVYVRPYHEKEIGALARIVRKVIFVLEPHYRNETVDNPPFMVSHTGWGEFAVKIRLYFHDALAAKPLVLSHDLRLVAYHTPEPSGQRSADDWSYVPFVREEKYDEIVLFQPTPQQRTLFEGVQKPAPIINAGSVRSVAGCGLNADKHQIARAESLQAIAEAKKVILSRIADVKSQLMASQGSSSSTMLQRTRLVNLKGNEISKKRAGRPKKSSERPQEFDSRQNLRADFSKSSAEQSNDVGSSGEFQDPSRNNDDGEIQS